MRCLRPNILPLLLVLMGLVGCWERGVRTEALKVDRTSPVLDDPSAPVLLNDALTVYFSRPIQPFSVTEDSVTLLDDQGHQVTGQLQVGSNWVAFLPDPPLAGDLSDGSFRPGAHYRLQLSGLPRVDRIRSAEGTWLDSVVSFDVFVAGRDQVPAGLPAILRPPASDLPCMVRSSEVPLYVAADAPRLQLHMTLPILPSSLRAQAFRVRLLDPSEVLIPRSVRLVTSPLDDHPGCTIEIDLGALPQREGGRQAPLLPGDFMSVELLGDAGLLDYSGRPPLPSSAQFWSVIAGSSLPICEWPSEIQTYASDDELQAGFEVVGSSIHPRVRVEAGNGSLGLFRPTRDVTLQPGVAFDRGDGQMVMSNDGKFDFSAIDIREGITVTVGAQSQPVRLLATGGMRVAGSLALQGTATLLPAGRFSAQPVTELIEEARVALVAAGDIQVSGEIASESPITESQSVLLLATASSLKLYGALPFQTVLVAEAHDGDANSRIEGVRGQSRPYPATFTKGAAQGADFEVVGVLPWRKLPLHLDAGQLEIRGRMGEISMRWQATPADSIRGEYPDLTAGRVGRWRQAREGDLLVVGAGAFVRLRLSAQVRGGQELPSVRDLRLVEN